MMKNFFVLIIFMSSPIIFYITHPIFISYLLVFYAFNISMLVFNMGMSWFMYLLVLIFLGGVMVLIMYMTTMAANEKTFYKNYFYFGPLLLTTSILSWLLFSQSNKNMSKGLDMGFLLSLMEKSTSMFYLWMVYYLLLVMIVIIKIVKFEKGPLVKRL